MPKSVTKSGSRSKGKKATRSGSANPTSKSTSTSNPAQPEPTSQWYVECILRARRTAFRGVATSFRPTSDPRWEYELKWAGFKIDPINPEWEPSRSLSACKRLLTSFWNHIDADDDDRKRYFDAKPGTVVVPHLDWIEEEMDIFWSTMSDEEVARQNADPTVRYRRGDPEASTSKFAFTIFPYTTSEPVSVLDDKDAKGTLAIHDPLSIFRYAGWNALRFLIPKGADSEAPPATPAELQDPKDESVDGPDKQLLEGGAVGQEESDERLEEDRLRIESTDKEDAPLVSDHMRSTCDEEGVPVMADPHHGGKDRQGEDDGAHTPQPEAPTEAFVIQNGNDDTISLVNAPSTPRPSTPTAHPRRMSLFGTRRTLLSPGPTKSVADDEDMEPISDPIPSTPPPPARRTSIFGTPGPLLSPSSMRPERAKATATPIEELIMVDALVVDESEDVAQRVAEELFPESEGDHFPQSTREEEGDRTPRVAQELFPSSPLPSVTTLAVKDEEDDMGIDEDDDASQEIDELFPPSPSLEVFEQGQDGDQNWEEEVDELALDDAMDVDADPETGAVTAPAVGLVPVVVGPVPQPALALAIAASTPIAAQSQPQQPPAPAPAPVPAPPLLPTRAASPSPGSSSSVASLSTLFTPPPSPKQRPGAVVSEAATGRGDNHGAAEVYEELFGASPEATMLDECASPDDGADGDEEGQDVEMGVDSEFVKMGSEKGKAGPVAASNEQHVEMDIAVSDTATKKDGNPPVAVCESPPPIPKPTLHPPRSPSPSPSCKWNGWTPSGIDPDSTLAARHGCSPVPITVAVPAPIVLSPARPKFRMPAPITLPTTAAPHPQSAATSPSPTTKPFRWPSLEEMVRTRR